MYGIFNLIPANDAIPEDLPRAAENLTNEAVSTLHEGALS